MVRPKASRENLNVCAALANAITVSCEQIDEEHGEACLDCRGSKSLFAALSESIPNIVRSKQKGGNKALKKKAVSEAELNKHLCHLGFISFRYRQRIQGVVGKWDPGVLRWRNRRWVNPNQAEEVSCLRQQVEEISKHLPAGIFICQEILLDFLIALHLNLGWEPSELEDAVSSVDAFASNHTNNFALTDNCSEDREVLQLIKAVKDFPCVSNLTATSTGRESESEWRRKEFLPFMNCKVPFQFISNTHRIRFQPESSRFLPPDRAPAWLGPWFQGLLQMGYKSQTLSAIFQHLPVDVMSSLRVATVSVLILAGQRQRSVEFAAKGLSQSLPISGAHHSFDDEEATLFEAANFGVMRFCYDVASDKRSELYVNRAFCAMANMSGEELLARVTMADLPDRVSHLDLLCQTIAFVHMHMAERKAEHTQHFVQEWPGAPPTLVERKTRVTFTNAGQLRQHFVMIRRISPGEYDVARNAQPSTVARLRSCLGDERSGAQLLADSARDRRVTIAALAATPAGRCKLSRLSASILDMFDPYIRAARALEEAGALEPAVAALLHP